MKEVTIVTSLFNIKREDMDGRKWQEYLKWFEETLKLKCPMIVFISPEIREFVENCRKSIPTEIITQTIEEIPYYYLKENLDNIISSDSYKNKIDVPSRIECNYSIYSIIQYSKFKWMTQAIEENPFNSKFFFWIDAGASRFFENFDLSKKFPSKNSLMSLNEMGDKFLVQLNMEFYKDLAFSEILDDEYLLDARSITCGSFFGGEFNSVIEVAKKVEDVLLNKMISNNFINNEQIVLAYLLKNYPDLFVEYRRYNGKHMDIFSELS